MLYSNTHSSSIQLSFHGSISQLMIVSSVLLSILMLKGCGGDKKEEITGVGSHGEIQVTSVHPHEQTPEMRYAKLKKLPKYINNAKFEPATNFNITLNTPPSPNDYTLKTNQVAKVESTPEGVKYQELEVGTLMQPKRKHTYVCCHLVGWLEDGTKFVSTVDRGVPIHFRLGSGQILAGLEQGMAGMKVGGTRKIVVPPELAIGDRGDGKAAPAGKTLIYKVMLLTGGL